MTQFTHARRPIRRKDVWLHQAGSENAALNPRTGVLFTLNDTAMAIWELCDGETTADEIIDVVSAVSQLHRDIITEDIERILNELEQSGLIQWESQWER